MLFMWPHMQGILQMEFKVNIYAQLLGYLKFSLSN